MKRRYGYPLHRPRLETDESLSTPNPLTTDSESHSEWTRRGREERGLHMNGSEDQSVLTRESLSTGESSIRPRSVDSYQGVE